MSDLKSIIEKYSNDVRIANNNDKIFKDVCVYSFNTSEHDDGLYVCLKTFIGVSREFLDLHFRKTQSHLYLNIKTHRKEVLSFCFYQILNTTQIFQFYK
jgi:ubiquitin carboxyl-terminal hydrolase 5/13